MLPEEIRPRVRIKYQEEIIIKKKMREIDRDWEDRKILERMKKDREIAYLHSDKTGKIVIMKRNKYKNKMREAIIKMGAERVTKDPNEILKEKWAALIRNGVWPNDRKPKIHNFAPNTPHIFGRIKDHKKLPTIRSIVNKKEAPTYDLEKYMKNLYKDLLPVSTAAITSTEEFINRFRELKINEKDILASFDIESCTHQ